jgi:cell division protein FtsB
MRYLIPQIRSQWLTVLLMMVVAGSVLDGSFGSSGPRDLLVLRQRSTTLANERDTLVSDNTALRERIVRLKSDDAYLQQLIRQELGYARPGEFVFRFARPESP